MKASINLDNGLLIESQSSSNDSVMIANAASAGFNNVDVRIVTDAELTSLIAARELSRMTLQDKFLSIEKAFDKHIDDVAASRGYGRVGLSPSAACLGYAAYPNQWQSEAIKYGQWVANCCAILIQGQADIVSGIRQIPTPEQAIAELPILVW